MNAITTNVISKVMAMVDDSMYSKSVCDYAGWLAKKTNAAVYLVHVLDQQPMTDDASNLSGSIGLGARTDLMQTLVEVDAERAKLSHKIGREILADAKARLNDNGIDAVTTGLRRGSLVETVEQSDDDTDLIIIGKRGADTEHDMLHLGMNLQNVVRASKKPVLVASRAFKAVNRLLIAFDGGDSVSKAIDYLAKNPVFKDIDCQLLAVSSDAPKNSQEIQQAADILVAAGLSVKVDTKAGKPESVIADHVENGGFDLLVMGAYGHSLFRHLIVKSTTTSMVESCKIPVLLFH